MAAKRALEGFNPLLFSGCPFCGSRVIRTTPNGTQYAGPAVGCCLTRSLHQANLLMAATRDPNMEFRAQYMADLKLNMDAIRRHLEAEADPKRALAEARQRLKHQKYEADAGYRILQSILGGA